jgi:hypothetical protein
MIRARHDVISQILSSDAETGRILAKVCAWFYGPNKANAEGQARGRRDRLLARGVFARNRRVVFC